jgi:hypothetical protein
MYVYVYISSVGSLHRVIIDLSLPTATGEGGGTPLHIASRQQRPVVVYTMKM